MAIKLDKSPVSIVVYCEECGHWRAFAWTIEEAHEAACRHERNVHPTAVQARNAAAKWRSQHADKTTKVRDASEDSRHGSSRHAQRRQAHV